VRIPPLVPSNYAIKKASDAAVASGQAQHMEVIKEGELVWGRSNLTNGACSSSSMRISDIFFF